MVSRGVEDLLKDIWHSLLGIYNAGGLDYYLLLATTFSTVSILLSAILLIRHWFCSTGGDKLRGLVTVIVLMVPIYALDARFSLKHTNSEYALPLLFAIGRELYESVVVVAFVQLLVIWLGGADRVAYEFSATCQKPQHVHVTILEKLAGKCACCKGCVEMVKRIPLPMFRSGLGLMTGVFTGVLQYSLVSVLVTISSLSIWGGIEMFHEGREEEKSELILFWLKIPAAFKAVSIGVALYSLFLLMFELERNEALKHRFEEIKPHSKFWCIKALVFATAIQKFVCETVLPKSEWLRSFQSQDFMTSNGGSGVQDFLLCGELMLFAIWHMFAYPPGEFSGDNNYVRGKPNAFRLIQDMVRLRRKANRQKARIRQLVKYPHTMGESSMKELFASFCPESDFAKTVAEEAESFIPVDGEALHIPVDGKITRMQFRYLATRVDEDWQDPVILPFGAYGVVSYKEFRTTMIELGCEGLVSDPAATSDLKEPLVTGSGP